MSETLQMWLFGAAFGLIGILFTLWWQHVQKCTDRATDSAKLTEKVSKIEGEIGDHEHGIIGRLHGCSKIIIRLCAKVGIGDGS